jgi:hypothetical protein
MKTILAELHDVITSLETKGFEKEAVELDSIFKNQVQLIKTAQQKTNKNPGLQIPIISNLANIMQNFQNQLKEARQGMINRGFGDSIDPSSMSADGLQVLRNIIGSKTTGRWNTPCMKRKCPACKSGQTGNCPNNDDIKKVIDFVKSGQNFRKILLQKYPWKNYDPDRFFKNRKNYTEEDF